MQYREVYQNGVLIERIAVEGRQFTLDEAIALRLAEISQIAKQLQDAAIEQYSPGEISTWDRKESDAKAILSGNAAPLLEHEANLAGIPVADLAQVIVQKAESYRMLSATVAGIRSRHSHAIGQLTTVEEVMSYVVDGWPQLG